ncbi:MAG: hypothetical protein P4L98_21390 [Ancalomicrobiaceae bacterium]|nr:hypothetical protein [Ancalomicrobiaceae bacterium]
MVVISPLLTGRPASAREPIDLWATMTLADGLQGTVSDDEWRSTVRLVNTLSRAVLLHHPVARLPCNDLELIRKMQIALLAKMPVIAILQKPGSIGFVTVIGGNRAEFLFSCNYQASITEFRPWLDRGAIDERTVSLMADLVADDFDNEAAENKAAIRQCIAANFGRNSVISAFCDGPAPAARGGSYFIGISSSSHKWE